ncbi:hypothetical protein [Prevotella sp.]|uniref:hypothetical protein n=1 Tax=Prevotella sp. TaxID=59823 RepID=UPI0025F3E903|nr:hypothetical protein [Prevotella sp.]
MGSGRGGTDGKRGGGERAVVLQGGESLSIRRRAGAGRGDTAIRICHGGRGEAGGEVCGG